MMRFAFNHIYVIKGGSIQFLLIALWEIEFGLAKERKAAVDFSLSDRKAAASRSLAESAFIMRHKLLCVNSLLESIHPGQSSPRLEKCFRTPRTGRRLIK